MGTNEVSYGLAIDLPATAPIPSGRWKGKLLTIAGSTMSFSGVEARIHDQGVDPTGKGWKDRVLLFERIGSSVSPGPTTKFSQVVTKLGVDPATFFRPSGLHLGQTLRVQQGNKHYALLAGRSDQIGEWDADTKRWNDTALLSYVAGVSTPLTYLRLKGNATYNRSRELYRIQPNLEPGTQVADALAFHGVYAEFLAAAEKPVEWAAIQAQRSVRKLVTLPVEIALAGGRTLRVAPYELLWDASLLDRGVVAPILAKIGVNLVKKPDPHELFGIVIEEPGESQVGRYLGRVPSAEDVIICPIDSVRNLPQPYCFDLNAIPVGLLPKEVTDALEQVALPVVEHWKQKSSFTALHSFPLPMVFKCSDNAEVKVELTSVLKVGKTGFQYDQPCTAVFHRRACGDWIRKKVFEDRQPSLEEVYGAIRDEGADVTELGRRLVASRI